MKLEYSTGGIDDETTIELVNSIEFNLVIGSAVLVERITLDMVILQYLPVQWLLQIFAPVFLSQMKFPVVF